VIKVQTGPAPSDERTALRDALRGLLVAKSTLEDVRRHAEGPDGFDPGLWRLMADQMLLQGIHIPERYGGQGFSFVELGVVLEEMGRALAPSPYFSSVCLAANAILNAGDEDQKAQLLPDLASGRARATVALAEPGGSWNPADVRCRYEPAAEVHQLVGEKTAVVDGVGADHLVVVARRAGTDGDDGLGLLVVAADAPGVTVTPLQTLDITRRYASVTLSGAPGALLGRGEAGGRDLARTLDHAAVCLAAEMVGASRRVLEMAVEYSKVRVQFGRPIGTFQAIKHRCADMLLAIESTQVLVDRALEAAADNDRELAVLAPLAKATASEAFFRCAAESIQIHGGIGFTWEHHAHLFFRRAKSSELFLGDPASHYELAARRLQLN
jgi:alkylation response protein AidB-like acyl-CoA dehydrogenase